MQDFSPNYLPFSFLKKIYVTCLIDFDLRSMPSTEAVAGLGLIVQKRLAGPQEMFISPSVSVVESINMVYFELLRA